MAELRWYQRKALDDLYGWFRENLEGNPCIVLPTGSGKSHVVAELCRQAITNWPETRILMLSHVKEILEQNAAKLLAHWPGAPLGIYSAGLGSKKLDQITFAGIQSVYRKAEDVGHVDLVVIDEVHRVNNRREGTYRRFLDELQKINPFVRVVGLTATPYRLGQGLLHEGEDSLISDIIEPASIEDLVSEGYLAPLRSKSTASTIDTSGVSVRGGEFVESQLAAAAMFYTDGALEEAVKRAADRKHWIVFCVGVEHAKYAESVLNGHGIAAATIVGSTPKDLRAEYSAKYRTGEIRALVNCNCLTTGFDVPQTDCLVMLRPTLSPGLYLQMAGRGMRISEGKRDCLVLDFAGLVRSHGPVTMVEPPKPKGEETGPPPTKDCPACQEIVHISCKQCPECGHMFEMEEESQTYQLHEDDVMGIDFVDMEVSDWEWSEHTSKQSGKEMLKVRYYPENPLQSPITEYLCVTHSGYAGRMAVQTLRRIMDGCGLRDKSGDFSIVEAAEMLNNQPAPSTVSYKRDGKFFRVASRYWRM